MGSSSRAQIVLQNKNLNALADTIHAHINVQVDIHTIGGDRNGLPGVVKRPVCLKGNS